MSKLTRAWPKGFGPAHNYGDGKYRFSRAGKHEFLGRGWDTEDEAIEAAHRAYRAITPEQEEPK